MATSEVTLLQFVALALPAVAILMQAILSFQSNTDEDIYSSDRIYTEFRFLELSFIGLLIAGGLFGVSLFGSIESTLGKLGLISMLLGLSFLAPATWFALRRPNFPSSSYDSPEDAAFHALKSAGKVVISVTAIGLVIVFLLTTFLAESLGLLSGEVRTVVATSLTAGVVLALTTTIVQVFSTYQQYKENERRKKTWYDQAQSLLNEINGLVTDHSPRRDFLETEGLIPQSESIINRIDQLLAISPQDIDEQPLRKVKSEIETYRKLCERRNSLSNLVEKRGDEIATIRNTVGDIRDELNSLEEGSEDWDEAQQKMDDSTGKLERLQIEQGELKKQRENIAGEIETQIDRVQKVIAEARAAY